jgi:hypothetical protein
MASARMHIFTQRLSLLSVIALSLWKQTIPHFSVQKNGGKPAFLS